MATAIAEAGYPLHVWARRSGSLDALGNVAHVRHGDIVELANTLRMDLSSLVDVVKLGSASSNALTLLNNMVTLDNVDHPGKKIEALNMQLFDTAMTESSVNANFVTARSLAGASGQPALLRSSNP